MLKQSEIMEALHQLAQDGIPSLKYIVEDKVPKNNQRPALSIEYISTVTRDANFAWVEVAQYFTLTAYIPEDARGDSPTDPLLKLQEQVLNLFEPGFIRVARRAPKVKASNGGRESDRAYIDLQLEYMDARKQPEHQPLMEELHARLHTNS